MTVQCTRFTKIPCFCPACMARPGPDAEPPCDCESCCRDERKAAQRIGRTPDVAELVRRVRLINWVDELTRKQINDLADACERMAEHVTTLRVALKLLRDSIRVMPKDDGRLYFDDDFDAVNFIESVLNPRTEEKR